MWPYRNRADSCADDEVRPRVGHQTDGVAVSAWPASPVPPDHGPGPSVSVAPAWGRPASGMDALWRDPQAVLATHGGAADRAARSSWLPDTVDMTVTYGLDGLELEAFGRH